MAKKRISTTVSGPTRTAVQYVPAFVFTEAVDAFIVNLDEKQYAALAGLLLLVFSWSQNLYENVKGKGFLRDVPPKDAPLPDAVTPDDAA